jgi:hypothetical protein
VEIIDYSYVSLEFGERVSYYIDHFRMSNADLAKLIKMSTNDIQNIIDGKKGVVLITMEKISRVFGLAYFKFGDRNFPAPKFKDLPELTRQTILNRKQKPTPERNYYQEFAKHLEAIVEGDYLKFPRTAKEVFAQMPKEIRNDKKYKATRVTDSFKNGKLRKLVTNVGYRGNELLFQLIEFVKEK